MGLPALKHEQKSNKTRSHLRVVRPTPRRASAADTRSQVLTARRNFRLFATLMAVIAALGIARVSLSVAATEASLEAARLRADIKSERYEGDMLEVRRSALGSPHRIQTIAGKAMDMAPAKSISYLDLTKAVSSGPKQPSISSARPSGLQRTLASVLDLTAGEAQVLLVGDVGLASAR
jgi:cell division protein FtsL